MIEGYLESRAINNGIQMLFRFPNGLGASIVRHSMSYGGREGLFELAVIKWSGDDFELDYTTPITNDVLGWLTPEDAAQVLKKIKNL